MNFKKLHKAIKFKQSEYLMESISLSNNFRTNSKSKLDQAMDKILAIPYLQK